MTQIVLPAEQAWTFARLPALLHQRGIEAREVTHIGAHHGEEVAVYRACGFAHINLVEPDPRSVAVLQQQFGADPDITVLPVAATLSEGTVGLHYAERTVWSGLNPHRTAGGLMVFVDALPLPQLQGSANVLVLDTQGTELDLLRVAGLTTLDLVIVETTRNPDEGAALFDDAVAIMSAGGWVLVEEWVHDQTFSDSVFARR